MREFLKHHGIEPRDAEDAVEPATEIPAAPVDPHAEVMRLRKEIEAGPDKPELKLDLALALLRTGAATEAEHLIDALPANLATDDRAGQRARASGLRRAAQRTRRRWKRCAPPSTRTRATCARATCSARTRSSPAEAGLQQFMEMLRRDRGYQDGLPRKALIDAFRIIDDEDLVGRYRRQMSALLLA